MNLKEQRAKDLEEAQKKGPDGQPKDSAGKEGMTVPGDLDPAHVGNAPGGVPMGDNPDMNKSAPKTPEK
jgi:hypothetical protein